MLPTQPTDGSKQESKTDLPLRIANVPAVNKQQSFCFLNYHDYYSKVRLVNKEWKNLSENHEKVLVEEWRKRCQMHSEFKEGSLSRYLFEEKSISHESWPHYLHQRYLFSDMGPSIDRLLQILKDVRKDLKTRVCDSYAPPEKRISQLFYADLTPDRFRCQLEGVIKQAKVLKEKHLKAFSSLLEKKETSAQSGNLKQQLTFFMDLHVFYGTNQTVMGMVADLMMIRSMAALPRELSFFKKVSQRLKDPAWSDYMTGEALMVIANWDVVNLIELFFTDPRLTLLLKKLSRQQLVFIGRWNNSVTGKNFAGILKQLIELPFVRKELTSQDYLELSYSSIHSRTPSVIPREKPSTEEPNHNRTVIILSNPRVVKQLEDKDLLDMMAETWQALLSEDIFIKNKDLIPRMAKGGGQYWLSLTTKEHHFCHLVLQTPAIVNSIRDINILAQIILKSFEKDAANYFLIYGISGFEGIFTEDDIIVLKGRCERVGHEELIPKIEKLISKEAMAIKKEEKISIASPVFQGNTQSPQLDLLSVPVKDSVAQTPSQISIVDKIPFNEGLANPKFQKNDDNLQISSSSFQITQTIPDSVLPMSPSFEREVFNPALDWFRTHDENGDPLVPLAPPPPLEPQNLWPCWKILAVVGLILLALCSFVLFVSGVTAAAGATVLFITEGIADYFIGAGLITGIVTIGLSCLLSCYSSNNRIVPKSSNKWSGPALPSSLVQTIGGVPETLITLSLSVQPLTEAEQVSQLSPKRYSPSDRPLGK